MIRPGKSTDAFALADVIKARYLDTRYAGKVGIDELAARRMFAQAAQRHGGTNEGGTCLLVNDTPDGIDAFILGVLSRVYNIGDMLAASDIFLLGKRGCHPGVMHELIDGYLAWSDANPKVYEIGLSWADSIPGNEGVTAVYERRGFTLCAKTYRRDGLRLSAQEFAA